MNRRYRRLALTAGALAAWVLYWHVGLLAILLYVWATAMASASNTAKARATATQHAALVSAVTTTNLNLGTTTTTANTANSRVGSLSGSSTSTDGLPNGNVTGTSDEPAPDSYVVQTSGVQGATTGGSTVAQHTHSYGHIHGRGSYTVTNGVHGHTLPSV